MGRTHYRAKGGRWTTSERQRVRDAHRPDPSGRRPLESCLRSKDSRAVWRGTGRKGSNDLARGLLYLARAQSDGLDSQFAVSSNNLSPTHVEHGMMRGPDGERSTRYGTPHWLRTGEHRGARPQFAAGSLTTRG